jgi:branched-chain amino acid transport system ATP-binding protein
MLLEVKELSKFFRGLHAVEDFGMEVDRGEIVGLIGPNGAGKTTIFNLITGVIRPTAGKIFFDGADITRKSPHTVAKLGVGRTFQLTPLFGNFTALQNVVASNYLHPHSGFWDVVLSTPRYRRNEKQALMASEEILGMVGLSKVKDEYARNLSHGFQKMLGIARALSVKPQLLMLDEPLGGLNADEVVFTMEIMQRLREQGVTVLVIEHNMQILDICDHVVVINFGRKICDGCVDEVRNDPEVIKAYLGDLGDEDAA